MSRSQYLAMCAIGFLALAAFLQGVELAKRLEPNYLVKI